MLLASLATIYLNHHHLFLPSSQGYQGLSTEQVLQGPWQEEGFSKAIRMYSKRMHENIQDIARTVRMRNGSDVEEVNHGVERECINSYWCVFLA